MNNREEGYVTGEAFLRTAEGEGASFITSVNREYKKCHCSMAYVISRKKCV
jgi:hypothetical protein